MLNGGEHCGAPRSHTAQSSPFISIIATIGHVTERPREENGTADGTRGEEEEERVAG